jgi:hypothetical protein
MNIMELKQAVDLAIERGIDPECTVVISVFDINDAGDWAILKSIDDPADPDNNMEGPIWFTLYPGEEADGRFTPAHFADY